MKLTNSISKRILFLLLIVISVSCNKKEDATNDVKNEDSHPKLILTAKGVKDIRAQLGNVPIFDNTLKAVKEEIDAEIALGIDTPIPKDYSGGYTHVRHKRNMIVLQKAGVLYQILEDEKYAKYVNEEAPQAQGQVRWEHYSMEEDRKGRSKEDSQADASKNKAASDRDGSHFRL